MCPTCGDPWPERCPCQKTTKKGEMADEQRPKLVVLESPYAGDVEANLTYLRACMADCLRRGEAPYASHALYTQPGVLDDTIPAERRLGMLAGFAWGALAARCVVYVDRGISNGMREGIARAEANGIGVEHRTLAGWGNQ